MTSDQAIKKAVKDLTDLIEIRLKDYGLTLLKDQDYSDVVFMYDLSLTETVYYFKYMGRNIPIIYEQFYICENSCTGEAVSFHVLKTVFLPELSKNYN